MTTARGVTSGNSAKPSGGAWKNGTEANVSGRNGMAPRLGMSWAADRPVVWWARVSSASSTVTDGALGWCASQ